MAKGEFCGGLRERVVIERRVAGVDSAGNVADEWAVVASRWAHVSVTGRGEASRLAAETRLTARNWTIGMRRLSGVTLDMRLQWRGLTLRLVGLLDDPAAADRMTLLAEELGS